MILKNKNCYYHFFLLWGEEKTLVLLEKYLISKILSLKEFLVPKKDWALSSAFVILWALRSIYIQLYLFFILDSLESFNVITNILLKQSNIHFKLTPP